MSVSFTHGKGEGSGKVGRCTQENPSLSMSGGNRGPETPAAHPLSISCVLNSYIIKEGTRSPPTKAAVVAELRGNRCSDPTVGRSAFPVGVQATRERATTPTPRELSARTFLSFCCSARCLSTGALRGNRLCLAPPQRTHYARRAFCISLLHSESFPLCRT